MIKLIKIYYIINMAKTIKRKVKSKKPLNLNQLKRLCLKKDKNIIKLKELEIIVAQEKDEGQNIN